MELEFQGTVNELLLCFLLKQMETMGPNVEYAHLKRERTQKGVLVCQMPQQLFWEEAGQFIQETQC